MAFRNDYEAQVRRSEALERELQAERKRAAELGAQVEELESRLDGSAKKPIVEPSAPAASELGLPPSRVRRVFAVCCVCLGSLTMVMSAVSHGSHTSSVPTYDLVEQLVYIPMSAALAFLGMAYFKWPAAMRRGFLVWGCLAVAIEIADFIAESVLFGTPGPWLDTIVWFLFPLFLIGVFLRREP